MDISVFQGFANWIYDQEDRENHCNKCMKILAKMMMIDQYKIDAGRNDTKNMEDDAKMDLKLKVESHQ